jgi:putative OPT family oligopeptide transporter
MTPKSPQSFTPFIAADQIKPELTVFAVVCGLILAVGFGAANAYLGLRVGMTIAASIPAAVVSMAISRLILRRDSVLENNMVQTIGSAGESVAGGAIFTLPVFFLWSAEWEQGNPDYLLMTTVCMAGGLLGVIFMIPLRRALIVKEHGILPYPEGTACARVLMAGEEGGGKAKLVLWGVAVGACYKLLADGFHLFPSQVDWSLKPFMHTGLGADILPALLGVGYIVGPRISAQLLAGSTLGWLALMPLIAYFGSLVAGPVYPAQDAVRDMDHWGLWGGYIRYIGAGAVAFGGLYSLAQSFPLIVSTFKKAFKNYHLKEEGNIERTDRDIRLKTLLPVAGLVVLAIGLAPFVPIGLFGALLVAVFGFFFAVVGARIVGLVGSSNSPVSGMTIATLLISAFLFKMTGQTGQAGMIATMAVGTVICVIAAIAGDTSQDLKTGFLLGATPARQQMGELIGVLVSAVSVGGALWILNKAWGFGSTEIPAPQATLMKLVVEGVMGGDLPWPLVMTGLGVGLALAILRQPILTIAIGLYLPIHLSVPMVFGGLIRRFSEFGADDKATVDARAEKGILLASGLIAGEGIVGISLAVCAALGIDLALSPEYILGRIPACGFFILLAALLVRVARGQATGRRAVKA